MSAQPSIFSATFPVVLAFSAVICFSHLHQGDLAADAIRHAHIAYNILLTGNWLELYDYRTETQYVNKPPLLFWSMAGLFKVFGFSTLIAKFPSALCALLALLIFYHLVHKLYDERTAVFALLLMAASRCFTRDVIDLTFDGPALLGAVVCMIAACTVLSDPAQAKANRVWLWFACGVFIISQSKVPYLALILFPTAFAFWRAEQITSVLKQPGLYLFLAPVLCFVLWWHWSSGMNYVTGAAHNQFIEPFHRSDGHLITWLTWIKSLLTNFFPAVILGPCYLYLRFIKHRTAPAGWEVLLIVWCLPILPIIALAGVRPRYLLVPMLPLVIFSGRALAEWTTFPKISHLRWLMFSAAAALILIVSGTDIELHRKDYLTERLEATPSIFNSEALYCMDDNPEIRGERLAKNSELLVRMQFEQNIKVYYAKTLPLERLKPGTTLIANESCRRFVEGKGILLTPEGEGKPVQIFKVT